jgi:hypothetical protein
LDVRGLPTEYPGRACEYVAEYREVWHSHIHLVMHRAPQKEATTDFRLGTL